MSKIIATLRKSKPLQLISLILLIFLGYSTFSLIEAQPTFCNSCHEMNFNYEPWKNSTHSNSTNCLNCHSEPGLVGSLKVKIRGIQELIDHIKGDYQVPIFNSVPVKNEQCIACHPLPSIVDRGIDVRHTLHTEAGLQCVDCHSKVVHNTPGEPTVIVQQQCEGCHQSHLGSGSAFPLNGGHSTLQCVQCHSSGTTSGVSSDCSSCHTTPSTHNGLTSSCVSCHTLVSFSPSTFRHPQVGEHFESREERLQCSSCHRPEYRQASCTGPGCHRE